jgi:hypothetical protein
MDEILKNMRELINEMRQDGSGRLPEYADYSNLIDMVDELSALSPRIWEAGSEPPKGAYTVYKHGLEIMLACQTILPPSDDTKAYYARLWRELLKPYYLWGPIPEPKEADQ